MDATAPPQPLFPAPPIGGSMGVGGVIGGGAHTCVHARVSPLHVRWERKRGREGKRRGGKGRGPGLVPGGQRCPWVLLQGRTWPQGALWVPGAGSLQWDMVLRAEGARGASARTPGVPPEREQGLLGRWGGLGARTPGFPPGTMKRGQWLDQPAGAGASWVLVQALRQSGV